VAEAGTGRRLVALNRAAERVGLKPGMSVADALAIRPSLKLAPHEPAEEDALLGRLAEWCVAYTPFAAPDPWREGIGSAGLWLDITGCDHLWGGEAALLDDLTSRLDRLGFTARAAVADSPGAAWGWARFGAGGVVESGASRAALMGLPVTALRLAPDCVLALARLGLRRVGDLYPVARAPLAARFGSIVGRRLDQALGAEEEPISPLRPPHSLQVQRRFLNPIGRAEDVQAAVQFLLARLMDLLARQQLGVRRLDLAVFRVDASCTRFDIGTSRPTRDTASLSRLMALQLDGLQAGFGIESLSLSASVAAPLPARQQDMTDAGENDSLSDMLDSLGNRLGFIRLQGVAPAGSHLPERAVRRLTAGGQPPAEPWPDQRRPPILLSRPEAVAVTAPLPDAPPMLFRWRQTLHRVRRAEGPERLEGEWWREQSPARDYYLVESEEGERFWLYRLGLPGEFNPSRWFVHGLFA
jgi:protein ImuB